MKIDATYQNTAGYNKTKFGPVMKMKFAEFLLRIQKSFFPRRGIDLETMVLKHRLKKLEKQLHAVDSKKIELEKLLSDFHHRHTMELGDLLLEILKLRTLLFPLDDSRYEEAKRYEERFREQLLADRKQQKQQITKDEKAELKKKFRKATVLCHPDKVDKKFSAEANEIFILLKEAYDSNNLKKVTDILFNLEKGNYFKPKSETVSERELLIAEIKKLMGRVKSIENDIARIKKSFEYKRIIAIDDWDEYFRAMKAKLEAELAEMKVQLSAK